MLLGQQQDKPHQATLGDLCLWLMGRRRRYRVDGQSMLPAFPCQTQVFVDFHPKDYAEGDVVVVRHPHEDRVLVKRIATIRKTGALFLMGDNAEESTDSRCFGEVSSKELLGKVTAYLES